MTVVLDACKKDTKKLTVIPIFYVGTANPLFITLLPALNTTSPTTRTTTTNTTLSTTNIILTAQSLKKILPTPKSYSTQLKEYRKYHKSGETRNIKIENSGTTQKG